MSGVSGIPEEVRQTPHFVVDNHVIGIDEFAIGIECEQSFGGSSRNLKEYNNI